MSEKEYRIASPYRDSSPTPDPKSAGERYRHARRYQIQGETIELQEREVGPWRTVEKTGKRPDSRQEQLPASLEPSRTSVIGTGYRWDVR